MYRAVTLYFLQNNIPIPSPEELIHSTYDYEKILDDVHISFIINESNGFSEVTLNDVNIENKIRTMEISENVSHVSSIKAVRKRLVALQQLAGETGSLVMDGRDIGTTVFPDADLKIFMKADPMVRAERRFKELNQRGEHVTMEEVINNIVGRDYEDTHREESPLRKADDAIMLDNTFLTQEEQVDFVMNEVSRLRDSIRSA
jgi:cytidylate kinase